MCVLSDNAKREIAIALGVEAPDTVRDIDGRRITLKDRKPLIRELRSIVDECSELMYLVSAPECGFVVCTSDIRTAIEHIEHILKTCESDVYVSTYPPSSAYDVVRVVNCGGERVPDEYVFVLSRCRTCGASMMKRVSATNHDGSCYHVIL